MSKKSPRPAKESLPNVTDGRDCLVSGLRVNSGIRKVMVMRVFVAGGTGVMGRRLVPQLVARGHQVTATTTDSAKLGLLEQLGADAVVMDGLDAVSVGEAVAEARPDAIVHQMTAIAGKPDMKHFDRWFATTNRLRTEGTDHLLGAAEATGVSNFVAQSYAGWNGIRKGGWVKTEEDPLDSHAGTVAHDGDGGDPPHRGRGRQGWWRGPAIRRTLRAGRHRRPGRARAQAAVPACRGRQRLHLVGASRRCGECYRPGCGAKGEGRVQHRRRRACPGQRVAALSGCVRGRKATDAGPQVAGPAAGRGSGGNDDDRGARLLQRQGQAGARLGAALSLVAQGLQGRAGVSRAEEFEQLRALNVMSRLRVAGCLPFGIVDESRRIMATYRGRCVEEVVV